MNTFLTRAWVALGALLALSAARAEEVPPPSACPDGQASLASPRAEAAPALDTTLPPLDALKAWRDELQVRYRACDLAPFEPQKAELTQKANAFSHELGRGVGAYRVKPEGAVNAELARGFDILDVEVAGNVSGAKEALAPMRAWSVWPLRNNGEVVRGCRLELTVGKRAELCLNDIDGVDRAQASAVTTQVRVLAVCSAPLVVDDVALVYVSPEAPPPLVPVNVERAAEQAAAFLPTFTTTETATRELGCNDGRTWCVGLTAGGRLALTQGTASKLSTVEAQDLDGFTIAAPGRWTGVEHTPSGLRVGRSAIGSYYGLPSGGHTRWWLSSETCMLWKRKPTGAKKYPVRVELGSLCQVDGIWIEGMQTLAPLRGEPRQVVQSRFLDDVASRCTYSQ